jgi:uncharacterized protein YkwD
LGITIVLASVSCGGGISQDEYDSVMKELVDAQDEIAGLESDLAAVRAVETEGVESSLKYQDLLKDYNAVADELESAGVEYDALNAEYEGLQTEHQTLQSQNESNLNQINLLQTENTQLQAQVNELTPPFPMVTATDLEQALFTKINEARVAAGLDALQTGSNMVSWSRTNCQAMSVAKQTIIYDNNFVRYQQHFIATGYNTMDAMIAAIMTIWQSNSLSYQNNILADDVIYGAVGVVKTGDIYYITYMANNFP